MSETRQRAVNRLLDIQAQMYQLNEEQKSLSAFLRYSEREDAELAQKKEQEDIPAESNGDTGA